MEKQRHLYISIAFAIIVLLAAMLACNFDENETITTTFEQYYSMDPLSLLNSLARGSEDLFTPIEAEPELPLPDQQVPVNWSQADYFHIVEAIYEQVWKDSLDSWSLKSMSFALGCNKIDNGFQNAHFQYFRNANLEGNENRIERFISIDARTESVYVSESEYSPRLTDWGLVDLTQIHLSATDSLKFAESNGGQEKRLAVENVCEITLLLSPDLPRYRGWDVRYTNKDDGTIFHIQIDPITGTTYFP